MGRLNAESFEISRRSLTYFYGLYLAPDTDIALAALCLVRTDSVEVL